MKEDKISTEEMGRAFENLAAALNKTMQPMKAVTEKVNKAFAGVHEKMKEQYKEAGYPYGKTSDDMYEYFTDLIEIENMRKNIEKEIEWKKTLMQMKIRMKERNNNKPEDPL